jgi:hypothetical protein
MYRIIPPEERKEYTWHELEEVFDGKWLYIVNAQFSEGNGFVKGIPVVVADSDSEGMQDGIYDEFMTRNGYGTITEADFSDWPELLSPSWVVEETYE